MRSSWIVLCVLLLSISNTTPSEATPSNVVDALQLVIDPVSGSSSLDSLAVGETVQVSAVVNRLSAPSLGSFQIGLEYDASLLPIQVVLHPESGVSLKPTLTDVYVGMNALLLTAEAPHTLATWTFLRLPGYAADHPAIIRMRALENGEPSLYRANSPAYHIGEFRDAGPVRIGATSPAVWRFLATTPDYVEGRNYDVEWESSGISGLTLDGAPVSSVGSATYVVGAATEHVLSYTDAAGVHESRIVVNAMREPRIDALSVSDPPTPDSNLYRINFRVRGATAIWMDPGNEFVSGNGERGIAITGPTNVTLRAENEWGLTTRSVVIQGAGQPVVASFLADPATIDLGQASRLSWSVVDADSVTLSPPGTTVALDGTLTVQPESTTTYTLTATKGLDTASETATVTVIPLRIEEFLIAPQEHYPGEEVTVTWSTINADSLWIEPDIGALSQAAGSLVHTTTEIDQTFTLHASRGQQSVQSSFTTKWKKPFALISWYASNWMPAPQIELKLGIVGADSAAFDPGPGLLDAPVNQSIYVPGLEPQHFRLTAYNRAGTTIDETDYVPARPRIASSVYAPTSYLGSKVRVDLDLWQADRGTISSPSILPEPIVRDELDGNWWNLNLDFWLDAPLQIYVTAENMAYTVDDTIQFGLDRTEFATMMADDTVIAIGDSTTLRWQVLAENARWWTARLEPTSREYRNPNDGSLWQDSRVIKPLATTQFSMTFQVQGERNYVHPVRILTTVTVVDGETSMVAEPMNPPQGGTFDLKIAMPVDATAAFLEPGIGNIDPHTQTLQQIAGDRTEYRLEVTTPRGMERATVMVEPDGTAVVPTLVSQLEFNGHSRGSRVVLDWKVDALRPPENLRIERARGEAPAEFWRSVSRSEGELIDAEVESGSSYTYRLRFEIDGEPFESDAVTVQPMGRLQTRLLPNIPNPFNPSTRIRWDLAEAGRARLEIYDLRGRRLRAVDLGELVIGTGSWVWDGRDDDGQAVASGAYIVRLSAGQVALSQKVVLAK